MTQVHAPFAGLSPARSASSSMSATLTGRSAAFAICTASSAQRHAFVFGREARRVVHEIQEHLRNAVTIDEHTAHVGGNVNAEAIDERRLAHDEVAQDVFQESAHIFLAAIQGERAGARAAEV